MSTRSRRGARTGRRLLSLTLLLALFATSGALAVTGMARTGLYRAGFASDGLLIVLAIGTDIGPPLRPGNPLTGRADGIHLFVADTATNRMTVVDIPRDSAIGGAKVNAYLATGGPERLRSVLMEWTGMPIDYYVLGSFQSVQAITRTLGGIALDVPQTMTDPFSGTNLQAGPQVVGPAQALAFSRDRKSLSDGDIGRSRNQTHLMLAALRQTQRSSAQNLNYVVQIVATLRQHTESNIPPGAMVPLAYAALRIQPDAIEQVTISGPFGFIGTQSVIYPQPGNLFERLNAGQVGPQ